MKSEYNAPPNRERLVERLRQLGQEVPDNPTAEEAAYAIKATLASEAVCSRCMVNGVSKLLRFREMWEHVYQRKWDIEERFKADKAATA